MGGWGGPRPLEDGPYSRRKGLVITVSLLCLVKSWRSLFWELSQYRLRDNAVISHRHPHVFCTRDQMRVSEFACCGVVTLDFVGMKPQGTTRAQDSTGHPARIKLCPLPAEERDKDTLCIIGPGTQQHWGKSFTNLYLELEVASDGPSAEPGWVYSSLGEKPAGWPGHR